MNYGIRPRTHRFALLLALGFLATPAVADDFAVDSDGDAARDNVNAGPTECLALGGGCTLRAAIQTANIVAGPHNITFMPGISTITLATGMTGITAPVHIDEDARELRLAARGSWKPGHRRAP